MTKMLRKNKVISMALILSIIAGTAVYAKPKKSSLVKQEPGNYYGFGEGATAEDAQAKGKMDLVVTAITSTIRMRDPSADTVVVSEESVNSRLGDEKVFGQSKNGLSVAYCMKITEWDKKEKAFAESLRKNLSADYQTLSSNGKTSAKLASAKKILSVLADNGETDNMLFQDGGTELYSAKVMALTQTIIDHMTITVTTKNGLISSGTGIGINVKDGAGKPVDGLTLKAIWEAPYLPLTMEKDDVENVVSLVTTDAQGNATIDFPVAEEYKDRLMCLNISTAFATGDIITSAMRRIDGASGVEGRFYCTDDVENFISCVAVDGGKYTTGPVKHDTKASMVREKAREVELAPYAIAVSTVTNIQYEAYLYLNGIDETPEYFDNPDYNSESQPVIGVSAVQAEEFAAWISEQTGSEFRLPTDDEWEVAAHAGTECIYPWGDDDPSKGKKANYKGNGKHKLPSPAGSFEEGTNLWGIQDMSGNVWEWTSTARTEEEDSDVRTVKGGSWLDGPTDLRISNFKNINKDECLPDVGFRLAKNIKGDN